VTDRPLPDGPVLNLFAKLPVRGQVKTRLIPALGADEATRLAERFITYTLEKTTCMWPGDRVLWLWPHLDHPLAVSLRQQFRIEICVQAPGDLGAKMIAALNRDLSQGLASAVMGCDLIHCPPEQLAVAARQLTKGDNIFAAAEDGGFWLLGLNQSVPALFDGIDWDAGDTGSATLERARSLGVRFGYRAPTLFDIDRPADLVRLERDYPTIFTELEIAANSRECPDV